jgi:hypothetical protein
MHLCALLWASFVCKALKTGFMFIRHILISVDCCMRFSVFT